MDDEQKSITEHMTDTVNSIVETTTEAVTQVFKPDEPKTEGPRPEPPAEEAHGQVYIPEATDAVAIPVPLVPVDPVEAPQPVTKRAATKRANKPAAKAKKPIAPKKSSKKPTKKSPKKSAPKKAAKKTPKKSAKTAASKKSSKKVGKKRTKKAKR